MDEEKGKLFGRKSGEISFLHAVSEGASDASAIKKMQEDRCD